jgi:hypothetical protein
VDGTVGTVLLENKLHLVDIFSRTSKIHMVIWRSVVEELYKLFKLLIPFILVSKLAVVETLQALTVFKEDASERRGNQRDLEVVFLTLLMIIP